MFGPYKGLGSMQARWPIFSGSGASRLDSQSSGSAQTKINWARSTSSLDPFSHSLRFFFWRKKLFFSNEVIHKNFPKIPLFLHFDDFLFSLGIWSLDFSVCRSHTYFTEFKIHQKSCTLSVMKISFYSIFCQLSNVFHEYSSKFEACWSEYLQTPSSLISNVQ